MRMWRGLGFLPAGLLLILPLAVSTVFFLPAAFDVQGYLALMEHPQVLGAWWLSVKVGVVSSALALVLAVLMAASIQRFSSTALAWFLSLPHVALAIGFGMLIAPTGLVMRLIAVLFTGWQVPPALATTQDPGGFGLMAVLVLKETPFLVWAMLQVLQQADVGERLRNELRVARSLGLGPQEAFAEVVLPQVLPRVTWPLIAVFSYGLTVVDMALVMGPTQPPTLANLVWLDLNDGEALHNGRGAAGTVLLTLTLLTLIAVLRIVLTLGRPLIKIWLLRRHRWLEAGGPAAHMVGWVFVLVYGAATLALALQSISALWPFPRLLAEAFTVQYWDDIWQRPAPLLTSLALAFSTSGAALVACVLWFECLPQKADKWLSVASLLMLCLPSLFLATAQYRLLLSLGWTGRVPGLFLVHVMPTLAYVFLMLQQQVRAHDPRWLSVSRGLGVGGFSFWWRVKWPLLKGAFWPAWAVGFAVSLAQFVPAQLAAAGRFATLPMEAITLASGGNRALLACYALCLMALALLGFLSGGLLARPRWRVR